MAVAVRENMYRSIICNFSNRYIMRFGQDLDIFKMRDEYKKSLRGAFEL